MDGWMDRWIRLASEMRRSSPEPVVRYMIEPVGLRVVAVGFEIYAVGFLLFVGQGIRLCRLKIYMKGCMYIRTNYVPVQAYKAFQAGHPSPLRRLSLGL